LISGAIFCVFTNGATAQGFADHSSLARWIWLCAPQQR
jgi:hypothetical protein